MRVNLNYNGHVSEHDLRDDGDLFGLFTGPDMNITNCMYPDASAPWEALVRGEMIEDENEDDSNYEGEKIPWSITPLPTPKLDQLLDELTPEQMRDLARAAMSAGLTIGSVQSWEAEGHEKMRDMLTEIAGHLWPVLPAPADRHLTLESDCPDDTRAWLDLFGYYVPPKTKPYKVTATIDTTFGSPMEITFTVDDAQGMRNFMRHPSLGYGMETETADMLWQGITHGQMVHYCNMKLTSEIA